MSGRVLAGAHGVGFARDSFTRARTDVSASPVFLFRLETSSAPVSRWLHAGFNRPRTEAASSRRRCEGPQGEPCRRRDRGRASEGWVAVAVIRRRAGSGDGARRPAGWR
jgi:hypothetical protein